jgi:PTS system nitrogen regulatory IIA component
MMHLADLLPEQAVSGALRASSKKHVLQLLAERAAALSAVDERAVFEALLQRERLGSTGVGHGVAIPHAKLGGIGKIIGLFARLEKPVDFEALDEEPVDLVFALVAPEQAGADHLRALARVARVLRDPAVAAKLRGTADATALHTILTTSAQSNAA